MREVLLKKDGPLYSYNSHIRNLCPHLNLLKADVVESEGSEEMKCHVATTGSILDFVGERVHGWDRSSSRVTISGVTRIGFGATIVFSWFPALDKLDKGGGVLRRGTPEIRSDLA